MFEKLWDHIQSVHNQRDVIPLGVNGVVADSDDDNEHPVFDFEDDEDDEDDDVNDA